MDTNYDTCKLCSEPDPTYALVTHDHRRLLLCGDCVRRFGVDEWRQVENLPTTRIIKNSLYNN